MTTTPDTSVRGRPVRSLLARLRRLDVLAVVVFVVVFLYRFNGLGGSLGGFDGDHFIYYLGAKQVAHGERPLRDFSDAGLQGAWPALTYELPALAQKWGAETLLAEAVYVVGAIAIALTVLFVTAVRLAGPLPAFVVTFATLFTATKLYGYPKVLVFSVAAALFVRYVRRPSVSAVVVLAIWSAAAFLFRHDYLVYLAPPTAVLVLLASGEWRRSVAQLLIYAAVLVTLLAGPLYSIQHFVGLRSYAETNLAITQSERARTNLGWPQLKPADSVTEFFADEKTSAAWLYYLCLAIPPLAVVALLWAPASGTLDVRQRAAVIISLAVLAVLLNKFLLRGNLGARIGDLGAPVAILAAWLATTFREAPVPVKVAARTVTGFVLVTATLAIASIGSVWHELDTTGFRDSFKKIGRRVYAVSVELGALPAPAGTVSPDGPNVSDYLHACTRPEDRVLVVADAPEILALADRPFAAGHPTFRPGFYTLGHDQELMLRRLAAQVVPVVVTEGEHDYLENFASQFTRVHAYITAHYDLAGELPAPGAEVPVRVFVRRGRHATSHYGATAMPCPI